MVDLLLDELVVLIQVTDIKVNRLPDLYFLLVSAMHHVHSFEDLWLFILVFVRVIRQAVLLLARQSICRA